VSIFIDYLNEVEILETWVAGWQTVDLGPYGINSAAKAVTLRFVGGTTRVDVHCGAKDIHSDYPGSTYFYRFNYCTTVVGLAGGTTIQIYMDHGATVGRAFITGEILGDDVVIYDKNIAIDLVEADFEEWQNRQVTLQGTDKFEDIVAAIVVLWQWDDGKSAIKHPDSSIVPLSTTYYGGLQWHIVGVDDDGYYQTYTTGKTGTDNEDAYFFEIGYILKTSGVVPIIDWNYVLYELVQGAWTVYDASSKVPANAKIIGVKWRNTFPLGVGRLNFARTLGSEVTLKRQLRKNSGASTQMITLNENLEFEYFSGSGTNFAHLDIKWYELPSVAKGSNIRHLIDDERLSANLSILDAVSLRFLAKEAVSLSTITDTLPVKIKGLKAEPLTSMKLSSRPSANCRKLKSDIRVSADLIAASRTSARFKKEDKVSASLNANTAASIRQLVSQDRVSVRLEMPNG